MRQKCKDRDQKWGLGNEKKKATRKRRAVNKLFFEEGLSKRGIARREEVSKGFVMRWTKSPDQDFDQDNRGWTKGRRRKWDKDTEERIEEIRKDLEENPKQFYIGATAVELEWRKRYPKREVPPLRTIGQIMTDLGLTEKHKKDRNEGAVKYLCYPEHTIYKLLGERVLEADFVGEKYITGRTEPLNFIGYSFKKEPRLRYFKRIQGKTADDFIEQTSHFFKQFEKPDCVKVDNASATIGSISQKRTISRVMRFLLENEVNPIFSVPRKPFTQASIEGNNSVFARMFWNKIEFNSVEEIDEKLKWFNQSSKNYLGYVPPKEGKVEKEQLEPKVYFTRQVREKEKGSEGYIDILNDQVSLSKGYINYFVLGEWNLRDERLFIRFEKEKESKVIKEVEFKINETSKEKCMHVIKE